MNTHNSVRAAFVRAGVIRACVPTPLVKNERGQWVIGVTRYDNAR